MVARSSSAIVIFSVGVDVSKVGVSDLRTSCLFVFFRVEGTKGKACLGLGGRGWFRVLGIGGNTSWGLS